MKINKKYWLYGSLAVVLLIGTIIVLALFMGEDNDNQEAQQIAVQYYTAVRIKGDANEARSLINDPENISVLAAIDAGVHGTENNRNLKKALVLDFTQSVEIAPKIEGKREFYIYQPEKKETYYIKLEQVNNSWKIAHSQFADSESTYYKLNNTFPGLELKWEEVDLQ